MTITETYDDAYGERVERELDADRQFFARNPKREHYIRPPFVTERFELERVYGERTFVAPPGMAVFVIVRQVAPGVRMRINCYGVEGYDTRGLDEQTCADLFQRCAAPHGIGEDRLKALGAATVKKA